jgi:hypothetical protein
VPYLLRPQHDLDHPTERRARKPEYVKGNEGGSKRSEIGKRIKEMEKR